jgi:hypothetical protein
VSPAREKTPRFGASAKLSALQAYISLPFKQWTRTYNVPNLGRCGEQHLEFGGHERKKKLLRPLGVAVYHETHSSNDACAQSADDGALRDLGPTWIECVEGQRHN